MLCLIALISRYLLNLRDFSATSRHREMPHLPMKFHAIPKNSCPKLIGGAQSSHGNDEQQTRGAKNPTGKNQSGFIQASDLPQRRDPVCERADIPPGGTHNWTSPKGQKAADRAVAAARFAVFTFKADFGGRDRIGASIGLRVHRRTHPESGCQGADVYSRGLSSCA